MEIKYQFFEKDNLLIQKFFGLFSLEDYLLYNVHIVRDLSSKSIKKVLNDFRDLMFTENDDEMPNDLDKQLDKIIEIRKNINQNEHKNNEVTLVIWVDNPLPTVIAHLFVNKFSDMNYNYCSTASKAIEILKIPSYSDTLECIVNNLEKHFKN